MEKNAGQFVYTKREVFEFFYIYYFKLFYVGPVMMFVGAMCFLAYVTGEAGIGLLIFSLSFFFFPVLAILFSVNHKSMYDRRQYSVREEGIELITKDARVYEAWRDAERRMSSPSLYVFHFKDKVTLMVPKRVADPALVSRFLEGKKQSNGRVARTLVYILFGFISLTGIVHFLSK
ncbi:hypothetical protein [Paenibacillus sp.]|uniref:hypothetical protein n=1 Tax=Paenibacillus sp. TaxID=58172 RepID=UPI002D5DA2BB|nr:hypothetical protein [Paenibacillus sp.]HZG56618.1 hypothetical protein [Paenibacillus sp.]